MVFLRKFISFLAVFITLFNQTNVVAYFYKMDTIHLADRTVHFLSDAHIPYKVQEQQADIVRILQKLPSALIVEDASICFGNDIHTKPTMDLYTFAFNAEKVAQIQETQKKKERPFSSPLLLLHSLARNKGIESRNVEFRFDHKRSLKCLFEAIEFRLNKLENELRESELYPAFKVLENSLNSCQKACGELLPVLKSSSKPLEQFIKTETFSISESLFAHLYGSNATSQKESGSKQDALETAVGTIAMFALDIEIIGALHALKNHPTVCVCVGGTHVNNVMSALQATTDLSVNSLSGNHKVENQDRPLLDLTQAFYEFDQNKPESFNGIFGQLQNLIYAAIKVISQLFVG